MNSTVVQSFKALEDSRKALMQQLQGRTEEELQKKPGEDQWSIVNVMQHLHIAEQASRRYMQKKILDPSRVEPANLSTKMRYASLMAALRSPIKVNAPAAVAVFEERDFASVNKEWEAERVAFWDFLQTVPDDLIEKCLFKHPIAGKMTVIHCLDFFQGHFDRHKKQIERIRKS